MIASSQQQDSHRPTFRICPHRYKPGKDSSDEVAR
jgi:hypothetical protein